MPPRPPRGGGRRGAAEDRRRGRRVLCASFEDESASVRLRAARTVLDLMFKGTEFSDWENRLRQLEEAADKTEHW